MIKRTTLVWLSFIMTNFICTLNASASTKKTDDTWVMENDALRVEVQADSAHMTVTQKSTGLQWTQEDPLERFSAEEKVKIWRATTPPTIDGNLKDWKVKDIVWLPWTGKDGEKNLSGGARLMWDDTHLYFYIRIRDNQRAFGKESTKEWWEADSVEFWIDNVQVGLHLCPGKEAVVNAKGEAYEGCKIAVHLIDEKHLPGYAVEVVMPIEHFPVLKNPEIGNRIYFAMGMNDADPKPGEPVKRVAQGYYPRTWVHSAPGTFTIAALTDEKGEAPPISKDNNRTSGSASGQISDMRKGNGENSLVYALKMTRKQVKPLDLEVELRLMDDEPAMEVKLSCPDGNSTPIETFVHPTALYPQNAENYFMAMTDYCDGRYLPVGDKAFRRKRLNTYGGDMPWVTVTDGKQGMVTIAMTPSDSGIQMQTRVNDEKELGFPGFSWLPSKDTFGYDRVGRYVFYDKGAHVKAAKIYREIAKEQGLVRKLTTDAETNPDVMKLMGAVNWWGAPGLSFAKEATAAGMKHGLINGRPSPESMEEIKKLGWLIGEYDNYEDINDSPTLARAKAPVKDHAVVKKNGEYMTAWVTRDKDMNPVHTFMKQCTGTMVKHAKAVIPKVLETYPYNTRFLDVTTATSLKECYSPVHGATRSQDLVNRQELLKYFSRELGLVTGGEHGRYYGVPYLHYHEGMMGGGMYGWPAGYLRDVEKREDVSERYLNYGINPANRAPLFELVFHDCVVNYWYWGACSDYLHQVMPELTDRKTAMNVLYGTPPMMWSHSHGLRWNIPEERELMLTIYRNVCKLHEIIGPQEMVSHAFLSDDRMVQQSTFEDGTVATVNFSKSPFDVTTKAGNKLTLLENDFYVHGPQIEQWRVSSTDSSSRRTYIRSDEYLFAQSGTDTFIRPGIISKGQVNIIVESDDRAKILLKAGSSLKLSVSEWNKAFKGKRALVLLDETDKPVKRETTGNADIIHLKAPADSSAKYMLYAGDEADIPDVSIEKLELSVNGKPISTDAPIPVDSELTATAVIRNTGLSRAWRFSVKLLLDGADGIELEEKDIWSLKPGGEKKISCSLPANMADGIRNITAVLKCKRDISLCGKNSASVDFKGPCNPDDFPIQSDRTLQLPDGNCTGMAVEIPFALHQGDGPKADARNLRVLFENGSVVPAQFEASSPEGSSGQLVFCIPEGISASSSAAIQILGVEAGGTTAYPHSNRYAVSKDITAINMRSYSLSIINGVLSSISTKRESKKDLPVMSQLVASSAKIGWTGEPGTVEELTCLQRGPVRTVISCTKALDDNHRLTRVWHFYPDRFEVHSTCSPHVSSLNRAFYRQRSTASTGSGKGVQMDGKGNYEDFGHKGYPDWYAVYNKLYSNVVIALSKCGGFTYWDSGSNLGQISLNHTGKGTEKRIYIWGPGEGNDTFARESAKAYKQGVVVKLKGLIIDK